MRRLDPADKTPGGIILPDAAKPKPKTGTVLAVGPGVELPDGSVRPLCVKAGDTILFTNYSGHEVEIDEEELLVLAEHDILARLEK